MATDATSSFAAMQASLTSGARDGMKFEDSDEEEAEAGDPIDRALNEAGQGKAEGLAGRIEARREVVVDGEDLGGVAVVWGHCMWGASCGLSTILPPPTPTAPTDSPHAPHPRYPRPCSYAADQPPRRAQSPC